MGKRGKFIALEGIDGAGTTTHTRLLAEYMRDRGVEVVETAEPADNKVGGLIREVLSGKVRARKDTLALLFAADRIEHFNGVIEPALARGAWVVSDRYLMSSLAYQSIHCDFDWVREINSRVPDADLTILLDLPVDVALERLVSREGEREIFEKKELLEKIRAMYIEIAKKNNIDNVEIVDASPAIEDVRCEITKLFDLIQA